MDSQNSSLSEDTGLNLSLDRTQNEATSSRILTNPLLLLLPSPILAESEFSSPNKSPSKDRFLATTTTTTSTAELSERKRRIEDSPQSSRVFSSKPLASKTKRPDRLALKYEDEEKEEEEVDEEQSSESEGTQEGEEELEVSFSERSTKRLHIGNNIAIHVASTTIPIAIQAPLQGVIQVTDAKPRTIKRYQLRSGDKPKPEQVPEKPKEKANENKKKSKRGNKNKDRFPKRARFYCSKRRLVQTRKFIPRTPLPTPRKSPVQVENPVSTPVEVEHKYDLRSKRVSKKDLVPSNIVCVGNMKDDGNGLEVEVTLRDRKTPVRVSFGLLEDYYSSAKRGGRAAGN
eukprot:TRINITY_DN465_c0_g1_i1.p1 TRINITY_DN465_c0_g1~~TRINITY_DN465_c0_g1_i1.p1  ORF type:complete len:344 (+),score=75.95 TRINITY_DN465_c0_g1_i1:402-1433(+)